MEMILEEVNFYIEKTKIKIISQEEKKKNRTEQGDGLYLGRRNHSL